MNSLTGTLKGNAMQMTWIDVTVTAKQMEAEGIASFTLASIGGQQLPDFTPGAHIDVEIAPGLIRQYSLCGAKEQGGCYLIGVLNDAGSRGGSRALHAVEVGQQLRISMPRNHFPLAQEADHSILIAGGIGITPILSMAERLQEQGQSFEMHFCARSVDKAAFRARIIDSEVGGKTRFYFDEQDQRIDLSELLRTPAPGAHLYVCGPQGFMSAVLSTAAAQGWSDAHLHKEFFVAAPLERTDGDRPFDIILSSTGTRYHIGADESIVTVLEGQGIEIPVSCEQGICGTCLTRVLEGEVEHRDAVLTSTDRETGKLFTPCCSRAKGDLLILDL